jgi:hypothetical protein
MVFSFACGRIRPADERSMRGMAARRGRRM